MTPRPPRPPCAKGNRKSEGESKIEIKRRRLVELGCALKDVYCKDRQEEGSLKSKNWRWKARTSRNRGTTKLIANGNYKFKHHESPDIKCVPYHGDKTMRSPVIVAESARQNF
jgi:hypothetical protein